MPKEVTFSDYKKLEKVGLNDKSLKEIVEHMREKHGVTTRVFEVVIGRILFENSYRLITDQVTFLLELYYIFKLGNKKVMFVD